MPARDPVPIVPLPAAADPGAASGAWPPEPPAAFWRDPASYTRLPADTIVAPLAEAAARAGAAPVALQDEALGRLHWYFTVDGRPRAPTVRAQGALADEFLALAGAAMRLIAPQRLDTLTPASPEVRHALLACHGARGPAGAVLQALDAAQDLVLLRYWVHGPWPDARPDEHITLDGQRVTPAFAQWRASRWFGRTLLHERLAWLPLRGRRQLALWLDGVATPVALAPVAFSRPAVAGPAASAAHAANTASRAVGTVAPTPLDAARARLGRHGPRPRVPPGQPWHHRLLQALAALPPVRRRYRDAWVFIDRETDADDNAEHLYRWVRAHRPEINAWFLLKRDSPHWPRLAAEGFRLVPPSLARRLLLAHAVHVVSSHAELVDGARAGAAPPRWRFSFVPHGISKDDVSHWLNPLRLDRFITSCPGEQASIVGDGSAYVFTERTARCTGLPRRDRLWQLARATPPEQVRTLLLMPTWRASLVDGRDGPAGEAADPAERLHASAFGQAWHRLLHHPGLRALADRHGLQLVFMAHANLVPLLDALALPAWITSCRAGQDLFQPLLARSMALVTDYSSVAFEMAFLQRPVFYYQPDRATFYGGDHNWRPGWFDYDRDGFGPVAADAEALLTALDAFAARGGQVEATYRARIAAAHPAPDDQACARVITSILALDQPAADAPTGLSATHPPGLAHTAHQPNLPAMATAYPDNPRPEMQPFAPANARRVLEVGCHTGAFGAALKARPGGAEVWGVEPNPVAAATAAGRLDKVLTQPYDDACPLPAAHFDLIVFNDVLEHVVDPWATLKLARQHLAPGGVVVASIPNLLHQHNLQHLLLERDFRYEDNGIRDRTHLRFFTRKSLLRMFEDSGYRVTRIAGINAAWWSTSWLLRLAYRVFARQLEETKYIQFAVVAEPLR